MGLKEKLSDYGVTKSKAVKTAKKVVEINKDNTQGGKNTSSK